MAKFTTTTSVDWEKAGTRTSVLEGKRKLKMQSVGRSTTTTLNVNTNVKLWCSFATKLMQDLFFLSRMSNFIDDEEFFVLSDLFEWKNTCFPYEDYLTFKLNEMTVSECLSEFRFGKRDILVWYRGSYMAAWGYEFYLQVRVLKVSLTSERSERVRDTLSTRRYNSYPQAAM